METTRLSTKGQIVLPKTIRTSRAWGPGTEFTVEETRDGLLLRPAAGFAGNQPRPSRRLPSVQRQAEDPAQMRAAIEREVNRRHDRGRY